MHFFSCFSRSLVLLTENKTWSFDFNACIFLSSMPSYFVENAYICETSFYRRLYTIIFVSQAWFFFSTKAARIVAILIASQRTHAYTRETEWRTLRARLIEFKNSRRRNLGLENVYVRMRQWDRSWLGSMQRNNNKKLKYQVALLSYMK